MNNQGGKVKVVLILVIAMLAGLVGAGGAVAFLHISKSDEAVEADEAQAEAKPLEIVKPIYVKVGPMTVNIRGRKGERLLYTSLMVKVKDEVTESFLQTQMPDINNRLLILLSQQTADELNAPGGKEMVSAKILEVFQQPFSDPQPELGIETVLFQDFIVQ